MGRKFKSLLFGNEFYSKLISVNRSWLANISKLFITSSNYPPKNNTSVVFTGRGWRGVGEMEEKRV